MTLPTVPTQDEYCLTPEQLAAWAELKRGLHQMLNAVDKLLSTHLPPKERQKRDKGNE
jgi:hypothetical protein